MNTKIASAVRKWLITDQTTREIRSEVMHEADVALHGALLDLARDYIRPGDIVHSIESTEDGLGVTITYVLQNADDEFCYQSITIRSTGEITSPIEME